MEQGLRLGSLPAVPLLTADGMGAMAQAEQAIHEATGMRMCIIEKGFLEPASDGCNLCDHTVEPGPRGVILRNLTAPRPLADAPPRPVTRRRPSKVRATATEAMREAATAAAAAAVRAAHAHARALEAAAQVGDATLRLRGADDAAAEAALAVHELARKQEDDELDAMIASGECDVGGDEALNLSGIEAPGSHMCQVADDPGIAELAHLLDGAALMHSDSDSEVLSESEGGGAAPSAGRATPTPGPAPAQGPLSCGCPPLPSLPHVPEPVAPAAQAGESSEAGAVPSEIHRRARHKNRLSGKLRARAKHRAEREESV